MNLTNDFENRYKKLNEKQREAVDALDGPVLVVAGPGSGKTEIISLRIANIIKEGLAKPDEILCLTFTDSASKNMLERLAKIMGSTAYKVPIFTFHAFCTYLIDRYPEHFFDAHRYEPIAELKRNEILESIFKNLKYGNPLLARHEERGYAYFDDVKERIKNLKEAGLNPEEAKAKLIQNKNDLEILKPILDDIPLNLRAKGAVERFINIKDRFEKSGTELGRYYASYLKKEIEKENLSEAKRKLFEKDENDNYIFKEEKYIEKLLAAVDIYKEYQLELDRQGLFDFDDMIIYVKDRLINNNTLRAEVEETYQYILLDEFQDTNLAQLKLIESITHNPVLEGKANIFVVGDDDQSIYKFQGAELNNIFHFKNMYKDVKTIVLTENYRSTQKILDFAKEIIEKAEERLTKNDKNLVKELISKNKELKKGEIYLNSFVEKEKEYLFIAKEIKSLLESGVEAKEIAIISRKHAELQDILPYLDAEDVPYNYERRESVFNEAHIEPLIKICKFLENVGENREEEDALLPEILSYEFLNVDRISVWEISRKAYKEDKSWLEVMRESENEELRELAKFFIELANISKSAPLEIVLDILVGSKDIELEENDKSDEESYHHSLPHLESKFVSNYKDFYFGKDAMKNNLASYIQFLSSLRVFIYALREYKKGEKLLVKDLSSFIKLHKDYNVPLLNKTSFVGDKNAINLLTAHKAKGLEFEYVFLIASSEKIWKSKGINNKLPLPVNMPFARNADNEDDFLRLYFVGATRAKHTIYITSRDEILSFLADFNLESKEEKIENSDLKNGLKIYNIPPFAKSEKALLEKILEDYKLSPTHLNNFLNIVKGGPRLFLEQNLLLFPQAKSSSAVYGSAMHKVIEELYVLTKKDKQIPNLDTLDNILEKEIKKARLEVKEELDLIEKGKEKLENFYNLNKEIIKKEAAASKMEVNFLNEGVLLENTELKGIVDRIFENDGELQVIDLKTGKAFKDFEYSKAKKEDYENIKKHNYKQQLMFYKILLENSRTFRNKEIKFGKINFVDDDKVTELEIDFENDISGEEWEDFKKLLINVFNIIKDVDRLQNIDISKYDININGILEFERDIINDNI